MYPPLFSIVRNAFIKIVIIGLQLSQIIATNGMVMIWNIMKMNMHTISMAITWKDVMVSIFAQSANKIEVR